MKNKIYLSSGGVWETQTNWKDSPDLRPYVAKAGDGNAYKFRLHKTAGSNPAHCFMGLTTRHNQTNSLPGDIPRSRVLALGRLFYERNRKMAKHTIDCTPKWKNLVPLFISWLQSGEPSQKNLARDEITRLAVIADTFKEHSKHGGLTCKCGETFDLS